LNNSRVKATSGKTLFPSRSGKHENLMAEGAEAAIVDL